MTPDQDPMHAVAVTVEPRAGRRIRASFGAQVSGIDPEPDASYTLTDVTTLDVADGGLALSVEEPMAVGRRVVVAVELGEGEWIERGGRIAWTHASSDGPSAVGIAFDKPVSGLVEMVTDRSGK